MKNKKNLVALMLVFVLCATCLPTLAFASEVDSRTNASLVSQLPDDAVILYQDEGIIMYQSNEETASTREVSGEDNYGYAWVTKKSGGGSFPVRNTHTGDVGLTLKIEGASSSDGATLYMERPNGTYATDWADVFVRDGDVRCVMDKSVVGTYTVHYVVKKNTSGMRIMAWTYK